MLVLLSRQEDSGYSDRDVTKNVTFNDLYWQFSSIFQTETPNWLGFRLGNEIASKKVDPKRRF